MLSDSVEPPLQPTSELQNQEAPRYAFAASRDNVLVINNRNVTTRPLRGDLPPSELLQATVNYPAVRQNTAIRQPSSIVLAPSDESSFLALIREKVTRAGKARAMVFVHGFNTNLENAIKHGSKLQFNAKYPGPVIAFTWPSAGDFTAYYDDSLMAEKTLYAEYLSKTINMLAALPEIEKIDLLGHSMGNRIILNMATRSQGKLSTEAKNKLNEVVFASPDVHWRVFTGAMGLGITRNSLGNRRTVYIHRGDRALQTSAILNGGDRAGQINPRVKPLPPGADFVDLSSMGSVFSSNHFAYIDNEISIKGIQSLVKGVAAEQRNLVRHNRTDGRKTWHFYTLPQ